MRIAPYIDIARPSHWVKNIFMLPGVLLVWFFDRTWMHAGIVLPLFGGFAAACLIASSNYVLNEILDHEKDRHHPDKRNRPIPSGQVNIRVAYAEWLLLGAIGIGLAFAIQPALGFSGLLLWVMGVVYNTPPIRSKDIVYADVLSESVNNPIRMAMGWYATGFAAAPPLSVLFAYWMFGAFLMGMKRLAEYRHINDHERAVRYRVSFARYNERRLIESIFFYGALFGMLSGVFMARYRIELALATPIVAYAMAYYTHLAFKPNSPVQYPELLYKQKKLVWLLALAFGACALLLFVDIPIFERMVTPTNLR
jgi:decaprenyl-phosphate phosphoribosyltransferase